IVARVRDRDEAVEHVVEDLWRVALKRVAIAAAGWREIGDDIARLSAQPRELRGLVGDLARMDVADLDLADGALPAAEDAPRRVLVAVGFMCHEAGRQITLRLHHAGAAA